MHVPALLLVVLWSCFGLTLVALVPLGYGIYRIVDDGEDDWPQLTSFAIGQLVVTALMTCSLVLLGHSISALWVWRGVSLLASIMSGLLCTGLTMRRIRGTNYNSAGAFLLFAVTAVTICFFVCSVIVRTLPYVGASSSAPFSVEQVPVSLTQLTFWHGALYVILAVASVVCGLLFIRASRTEGPVSFERNGGGLGIGSGGWELSNALTYLIATIALSALLLSLLFHNDALEQDREKRQDDATHKAASAGDVSTPPTMTLQKPEADKTLPAAGHAAGADANGH